jgi:hypothetical protein
MTSMGADIQEQVLQYVNLVKNNVLKHDPTTIGVLVAILVVFLTIGNKITRVVG